MPHFKRILICLLVILVALFCQLKLKDSVGQTADIVLAALVTFAFFVSLEELILFDLFAAWLLNWGAPAGVESLVLLALPIAIFFFARLLPWQAWVTDLAAVGAAIILFYIISDFPALAKNIPIISVSLVLALVWSACLFYLFRYICGYKPRSGTSSSFSI